MTTFSSFASISDECTLSFDIANRHAIVAYFKNEYLADYCRIMILSKTSGKTLKRVIVRRELIADVKTYSGLMIAIKDDSLHYDLGDLYNAYLECHKPAPVCPHSVSCDTPTNESGSQDGGNPPPLPVSSNPTAGGNLLHSVKIKNNSIKYLKVRGSVTSVIELYGDKYTYHLPMDAYYKIKKIDDDCRALHGYPIGIKRHLKLCKKLCYDANNERYSVA